MGTANRLMFWTMGRDALRQLAAPLLAGLLAFVILQVPLAERSLLGAPDRDMLQTAFKLRQGVVGGPGDPAVWIDLDLDSLRAAGPLSGLDPDGAGLSSTAPRALLANALDFARRGGTTDGATLVLLDVDLGWRSADPAGDRALADALARWADDPGAPLLLLARESFALDTVNRVPTTPFDGIVARAPNIAAAGVGALSDNDGMIREFVQGHCAVWPDGKARFPPSVVLWGQAAQAVGRAGAPSRAVAIAAVRRMVEDKVAAAADGCARSPASNTAAASGGLIAWHLGFRAPNAPVAAPVAASWPHREACGVSRSPPGLFRVAAGDLSPDADARFLCRALVVIGANNPVLSDSAATPYGYLPGPVILANAIRGHFETGGLKREGLHPGRLALQLLLVLATVVATAWAFDKVGDARGAMRLSRGSGGPLRHTLREVALAASHPLVFKFITAGVAFAVGAGATALGIAHGMWGVVSAPAYCAALIEAWRQLESERAAAMAARPALDPKPGEAETPSP